MLGQPKKLMRVIGPALRRGVQKMERTNSIGAQGAHTQNQLNDHAEHVSRLKKVAQVSPPDRRGLQRQAGQETPHREALKRSAARVETARAALGQIADLVGSVSQSLKRNAAASSNPLANERLVQTAHATALDIVEHARIDGTKLLGTGRLQSFADRVSGQSLAAIKAYGKSESAFQASLGSDDPPLVKHALATAKVFVSGPDGILETLHTMAERGPSAGPEAEQALESISRTAEGLRTLLADARMRDIDTVLNENQAGLPPDLKF